MTAGTAQKISNAILSCGAGAASFLFSLGALLYLTELDQKVVAALAAGGFCLLVSYIAAERPNSENARALAALTERLLAVEDGDLEPDRVLDLHGMNLDNAWNAIDRSLDQAIQRGDRVILLITGHHRTGAPPVERGKIRAAVHDWLAASRHAGAIAAVRGAHRRHGGGGSLYLVLRRRNASRR